MVRTSRSRNTSSSTNDSNSSTTSSKDLPPPSYTYCLSAFETFLDGGSNSNPFGEFDNYGQVVEEYFMPSLSLQSASRRRRLLESSITSRPSSILNHLTASTTISRSDRSSRLNNRPSTLNTIPKISSLSIYFVPGDVRRVFLLPGYQKATPKKSIEKTKNVFKSIIKWAENSKQYNA